jgi:hypothetical protein
MEGEIQVGTCNDVSIILQHEDNQMPLRLQLELERLLFTFTTHYYKALALFHIQNNYSDLFYNVSVEEQRIFSLILIQKHKSLMNIPTFVIWKIELCHENIF